ncbi:MAG TPA: TlpA disulfide reductase family protein [Candidatus Sulfopaludibacter sp.]|jgi:peroxiredoxin/outer membrane lipoprotein-sorting protein|nr:TlpA disulfide reductase family protein [Candidatus Sulfopaludibacter sp.]
MTRISLFLICAAAAATAQTPDVGKTIQSIGTKCQAAQEYLFEGDLMLVAQRGTDRPTTLSLAKVKFAVAPAGKSYLRIEAAGKDAYVLISNGQKSWAWVPKLKQYTEDEAAVAEDQGGEDGGSDSERDLAETWIRMVMPALGRLQTDAQSADFHGEVPVKFGNRKENWPLLRVLAKPAADKSQILTQIAIDPETLAVGRMIYSAAMRGEAVKTVVQMTLDFTRFEIGPLPESTFEFEAPKGVKLVETVPIPGQTGSSLLNQAAPDFELKTLDGDKIHLSELRGKPVLLSFWASWCGPCRRELPALAALNQQYKDKGLVILGVNDEGKGPARKYSDKAELTFQTLDDSNYKAHRLYKVHSIPSLFLINKNGKVVVFMKGSKEPAKIKAALASVGL